MPRYTATPVGCEEIVNRLHGILLAEDDALFAAGVISAYYGMAEPRLHFSWQHHRHRLGTYWKDGRIALYQPWSWGALLHELAHHVNGKRNGRWHGPEFKETYRQVIQLASECKLIP